MIDTKRIHKIKDEIRETSEVGVKFFKREFDKFNSSLEASLKEYDGEVVKVNRKIVEATTDLKTAQDELDKVLEIVEANKGKLKELDDKEIKLKEKEDNLLELHKVLTNKQKMLDAKEKKPSF